MTKSMACPFCGMRDEACYVNGLNGANVYQCQWCGAQTCSQEDWESRPLEESLRDKNEILQSKLAKYHQVSDAQDLLIDIKTPSSIENTNPDYYKQEIARRDEIITRLKEDAERLAKSVMSANSTVCYCGYPDFRDNHAPDCPITLHRALMKELE